MVSIRRRQLLTTCSGVLVGSAGCSSTDAPAETADPPPTDTASPEPRRQETERQTPTRTERQPPDDITESWPQYRGNSRNAGFRTDVTPPSTDGIGTQHWSKRVRMETIEDMIGTPAVGQGAVIAPSESGVHRFDARTGTRVWSVPVEERPVDFSPAIADGRVYASGASGLYAISFDDGTIDWRYETSAFATFRNPPVVTSDGVFVSGDGGLFAFGPDGEPLWDRREFLFGDDLSGIAVDDGTVYAAYRGDLSNPGLAAFAADTGEEQWSREIQADQIETSPVLGPDRLYVGTMSTGGAGSAGIRSFRRSDGSPDWQQLPQGTTVDPPAIAADTVYVRIQTLDREVFALERDSGAVRWRSERQQGGRLVVAEDQVIVAGHEDIYALGRADGTVRWATDTITTAGMALADGLLFTVTVDGLLVALR